MRAGHLKELAFRIADLLGVNWLMRWRHRGQLKVLLYHHIKSGSSVFADAVPDTVFVQQLRYLKRTCNLVHMTQTGELVGMRNDRVNVLLTFDDGFIDNANLAVPILQAEGARAVFFVIADCMEHGAAPAFQLARLGAGDDQQAWRTVTGIEVMQMRKAGMTIGSHSLSHVDLRGCDDDSLLDQARRSRSLIEATLGEPVGCFALPWGHHNPGQPERLADVYQRVFLTRHGFAAPDQAILPRNEVTTLVQLKVAVSGAIDIVARQANGGT